ncbi:MAG: efflux RND transporter periplasmic adaptor subunit [Thermoanaerobaculaceae bacterium]|nr:efflux RND transporter periplasmic adaptor subunit [Thermoanaerobaculaceae bacterium]
MARTSQLLILVLLTCGMSAACKGGGEDAGASRRPGRSLVVRTAPVAARDVVYRVQALGSLEPEELVQITAEVTGAVKEVLFHAGDRVTADTVLARIDPDRYRLEADRAEASHRRAVADWKRAEADLQRREALALENLVAPEELNRARLEAERLAADAASARAAAEIAQQNLRRSAVRPSRAGEIDTRTVDTGQFVQVGNVLATLVDPRRLRLRFKVSDSESLKAETGQTVTFRVSTLGDTEFTARVYHVGDVADPATRQVEILAWVDNPGTLKPGFFAEVMLATETHQGAIVIAESAVQASERGFVVYVVADGTAHERPIRLGQRTGDGLVEVQSGLAAGEVIVSEGSDRLTDGIAVEVAADQPAAGVS